VGAFRRDKAVIMENWQENREPESQQAVCDRVRRWGSNNSLFFFAKYVQWLSSTMEMDGT
jgi:hypothetical protein